MSDVAFKIFRSILINNPLGLFIRMILVKLSLIVFLPALIVTYWIFMGLNNAGILDKAFITISRGLLETQAVAQNCTPKILNFSAFWACIEDPGQYVEHPSERLLRERLRLIRIPADDFKDFLAPDVRNPYSQDPYIPNIDDD